jgi:ribosome modulation factor
MTMPDLETVGELTPFEDGYDAFLRGAERDACPWLPETDECLAWLRGWDAACREDEPNE